MKSGYFQSLLVQCVGFARLSVSEVVSRAVPGGGQRLAVPLPRQRRGVAGASSSYLSVSGRDDLKACDQTFPEETAQDHNSVLRVNESSEMQIET